MEACAGAHYWAREIAKLGHHVRLIAPAYVKPFIKRQKNDAADAEAICEAAQRPSMRFVPVKTEEQQANGIVFRARDLLVRQRTQCVNALRGYLMEYGYVFPKGITHVATRLCHGNSVEHTSKAKSGHASCRCDRIAPLCASLGSEYPQRGSGDEVALKVEGVVNRTVHAQEALGGSS
jgi:transposase